MYVINMHLEQQAIKSNLFQSNTLANFRKRLLEYEAETEKDLVKEAIVSLSGNIAKFLKVD